MKAGHVIGLYFEVRRTSLKGYDKEGFGDEEREEAGNAAYVQAYKFLTQIVQEDLDATTDEETKIELNDLLQQFNRKLVDL